ncbi:MAG: GNAT family N-acetyltransferase [Chloroflexi bacterium]|nr:GNAT family N-acetyltransferase [Chloroflexota bacterium]
MLNTAELPLAVLPAAPEHWPDIEAFFANIPCTCQYWRLSSSEYGRGKKEGLEEKVAELRSLLRQQLEGEAPPGILAYRDGKLVGWCGLGRRGEMQRLVRSRTIPKIDDVPVWAIVCFIVAVGHRRMGIANRLLRGAVECARQHGAPAIEAYPIDPMDKRVSGAFAYVGTVSMFEREGFARVQVTDARSAGLPRWLMRLEL